MNPTKQLITLASLYLFAQITWAATAITIETNIAYRTGDSLSDYERERCRLDLYLPAQRPFPTLVWFHGGGLTGGHRDTEETRKLARAFATDGIAVAAASYRLHPTAKFPDYIADAAAAVAWVHQNGAAYGGLSNLVFVGGHSAGAYLTSMLGMDERYLQQAGASRSVLAGLLPVSGQMMTHYTVRAERGLGSSQITADEAAPIFFTRADTPPMLILMGDHDWPGRLEENQYFAAMQRLNGNTNVALRIFADRDHGSIVGRLSEPNDPVYAAMLQFIRSIAGH